MKTSSFLSLFRCTALRCRWLLPVILLTACDPGPMAEQCRPLLPALPAAWQENLGIPHWRLEWIDTAGMQQSMIISSLEVPVLDINQEWTTPVMAWPFWPEKGIDPEQLRPAGGFFPLDYRDGSVVLTWQGGVDGFFYQKLAAGGANSTKLPWFFDWSRFREFVRGYDLSDKELRKDLWLADWEAIAGKVLVNGFDKRYIKAVTVTETTIPHMEGKWAGSSPFAAVQEVRPGKSLSLKVKDRVDTWFSAAGVIKADPRGWTYRPYGQ